MQRKKKTKKKKKKRKLETILIDFSCKEKAITRYTTLYIKSKWQG